jgi:hypothetical protein
LSVFVCPKCGASLSVVVAAQKKAIPLEEVRALFPSDLEQLLTFEQKEGYIILKPKRFLGTENFAKIAHIVRANKGVYISAGKNSHFKI